MVRDKDGISAALALLSLAATARAAGQSLLDRWDALEAAHGVHLTAQVTLPARAPAEIMAWLRADPAGGAGGLAGDSASATWSAGTAGLPPSDVLTYQLPGARVVIRPSGTEPKIKAYLEVAEPLAGRSLAQARSAAAGRLGPLHQAVTGLVAAGAAG